MEAEVRPVLTTPQARALVPGMDVGVRPVFPLSRARAILKGAEERALRGSIGLMENEGADLLGAILALRKALAEAENLPDSESLQSQRKTSSAAMSSHAKERTPN